MPISVNLTYRANLSQPLTWAQGDANFKQLADNDVFLNSAVEAAALAASQANTNANGRQPANAKLTAIAASVWAANQMILTTGVDTLSMIPVNAYGLNYLNYANKNEVRNELSINNVDNTSDLDKPISTVTQTALNTKINNSQKGVANGVAALGADGKLPVSQLPPLAVNETFIVNSQAEQLALVAERGDMAFRTDQANTPYVLTTDDPSIFANWRTLDKTLSDSLAALNVLTPAADRIPIFTGALTAGLQIVTNLGKTLMSIADDAAARLALSAAKSGANSDITSLSALSTVLTIAQGGTGKNYEFRKSHIEGLMLTWNSAQSLNISEGSAYIPSAENIISVLAPITLSGIVTTANTFYHIYLYLNSGVPAIEVVTTNPIAYSGGGYTKTGDNTRRFLGSVLSGPANTLWPFTHSPLNLIQYAVNILATPFNIMSSAAIGPVRISCAAVIPVTGYRLVALFTNNATDTAAYFVDPTVGPTVTSRYDLYADRQSSVFSELGLNSSLQFEWGNRGSANGLAGVYAKGYYFKR